MIYIVACVSSINVSSTYIYISPTSTQIKTPHRHNSEFLSYFSEKGTLEPKYTISNKGRMMLIHNGSKYSKRTSKQLSANETVTRWRCAFLLKSQYVCTAKASTYSRDGFETVTFDGTHNHAC